MITKKLIFLLFFVIFACKTPKVEETQDKYFCTEMGGDLDYHSPYAALPHYDTVNPVRSNMQWADSIWIGGRFYGWDFEEEFDEREEVLFNCEPSGEDVTIDSVVKWHLKRIVFLQRLRKGQDTTLKW